jgi:hypothetical protein
MRGGRRYCDAGVADFDPPDAMMERQTHAWPAHRDLARDPLEGTQRQRFIRFVLEVTHGAAQVAIAHQAEERHYCAV